MPPYLEKNLSRSNGDEYEALFFLLHAQNFGTALFSNLFSLIFCVDRFRQDILSCLAAPNPTR